jgi:uncharacterized protein YdaU (DUF1376 family)
MNYYEHHIGDYDANTAHLSWAEDMAYTRLIRWYYRKERPIPADLSEACRQIRAVSREQKLAVESVLKEFFELRETGWHKDRCDELLAAYHAGEPEREAKKANEEARLKRHREERSELFRSLTEGGQHAAWNIGIKELRELVRKLHAPAETPLPATEPATPATATHKPLPTTHYPAFSSVPIGTGGQAADGKRQKTPDELRKSELWRAIKTLLVQTGESKDLKAAGAVITKAITRFDEPTALAAIEATLHANPAGVIAYLEGACQNAAGTRLNKQEILEAGNLAAAERFAQG